MRDPVEAYFTALRDIHASGAGVAEVSYYGALEQLLTDIGSRLKPKVRAFMQLSNRGAGNPDGGLFTANQFKHTRDAAPLEGQPPARGAIEVKGTGEDVFAIAASPQVARYVEHYGLVLVTNLRDFVLVGRGPGGEPRTLESCQLATGEAAFWGRIAQPRAFAQHASEGLTEFLRRAMLHKAPLADPKDVAWFLASYARTARLRLEHRDLPALAQLREQLEEALGLKFEGERGDHFFRSTLVQTLFYGMFASWVLWTREQSSTAAGREGRFEWETASATLHVPMVSELFYQFSNPGKLRDLALAEVLEWAEEVLNRVDRAEFFRRFAEDHAVQYFYEPFLEAFDPELRKELGVWYTPDEVVKYMVARVDWALRTELGIEDGLADPSVYVLDPCCGTGAYLIEVLRTIDATLTAKGADALTRHDVKRAAMERVIGFEIMPAPFVVAHLQLGLLLSELGVPLSSGTSEHERAAVYLTNALTGWSNDAAPPKDRRVGANQIHSTLLLSEFAEEKDAANQVKREAPVLVVLGNPPYNSYAGTSPVVEEGLVDPYKQGLVREWGIKKFNLDDLYIRFFRLAERCIAERGGRGVVCYISNFSWLGDGSFVVMRKRLLAEFDALWLDNLNGDSRETGKLTPEGKPDPSIFSTEKNREGIRVGTAISLLVRKATRDELPRVRYREFWGVTKRADLLESLSSPDSDPGHMAVAPSAPTRFSLRPRHVDEAYLTWPRLTDLCAIPPINGLMEKRAGALFDIDRDALEHRMRLYFDSTVDWTELDALGTGLTRDAAAYDARATRTKALSADRFEENRILRYAVRPFEDRWAYYSRAPGLWNRARPSLFAQLAEDNAFLLSRVSASARDEGVPFYFTGALSDDHLLSPDASCFTLMLPSSSDDRLDLEATGNGKHANLSKAARVYLEDLKLSSAPERKAAGLVWMHALAIGYSNAYLTENADGVKTDWPRIPLPCSREVLESSATLGEALAALLDPAAPSFLPRGSTPELACVGVLSSVTGNLDPASDLAVTARWGIAGSRGVTMPSTGRVMERDYTDDERTAIVRTAESLSMTAEDALALLGKPCYDVYLNDVAYWRCVPANVWRYTIGGYQVIKKWLSYRERALLGRDLRPEEARYVGAMVRRIAAFVLMGSELDVNYERVKADVWEWGK